MSTRSIWQNASGVRGGQTAVASPGALPQEAVDVCVVGAGIAGLSVAYELSALGLTVAVLDRNTVGAGETSRTSAHLSNLLDFRYSDLSGMHPVETLRLVAQSHTEAIRRIEYIAASEGIDCGFARVSGYLVPTQADHSDVIAKEARDASGSGLQVSTTDAVPLLRQTHGFALQVYGQGIFHPLQYLGGLAAVLLRRGVTIHSDMDVTEIEPGDVCIVRAAGGGVVRARHVVQASNTPFAHTLTMHTKQAAYRTYVAAFAMDTKVSEHVLIWDTADPYHFVRTYEADGRYYLLVGGEDHKTGHGPAAGEMVEQRLTAFARSNFPLALDAVPEYFWSGQILEPMDGLAYIGRIPGSEFRNQYVVTGTSGNGLTYGAIAGLLIADLVEGRTTNPWEKIYDPGRVNLSATGEFVKQNLDVVAQYTDWLTPGEAKSDREVRAGSGAIVREGASKLAIYRDPEGNVHRLSATCPHLGCLVSWNAQEQTWDCPCHGSRFAPEGQVLNGPATSPLARV